MVMEYKEFLKQPEIKDRFNNMLKERQKYYMTNRFDQGFDKVHCKLMSIKMACITTDMYYTSIHEAKNTK